MRVLRLLTLFLTALVPLFINFGASTTAQEVPTRVPPTLVPPPPSPTPYPPIARSALARIRERGKLIVGMPFNRKPFSGINALGVVEGFEADIARAIAEDWGIPLELRHVTRHTADAMLRSGAIDLLMGQQIIRRDAPEHLDFSHPIFVGLQVALAMADSPLQSITELSGQSVGVIIGSHGEEAFLEWSAANGLQADVQRYAMLDDALAALGARQIAALVDDRWALDQRVRLGGIQGVKLLQGAFRSEPYGIVMLRYDDSLRTLVNRTLQRLVATDRLTPIYDLWFPEGLMPRSDRVFPPVWLDLDADPRLLQDFPVDIVRPERSVVEKLRAGEPLRVAGLGIPPEPNGQVSLLERFNSALVFEMARRWSVQVALVQGSYTNPEDVLASGAADLAVGLTPRWSSVDRVDFAAIYAQRGYRMFARVQSNLQGFSDLRTGSRVIGTFADEPEAFEIARNLAVSVGINPQTVRNARFRDEREAVMAVFENNVRVFFGDALRVVPIAQANANRVALTPRLYNPRPLAFGVPRNDVPFRMLVEATLQEMARDGTYERLWREHWNIGDPLPQIIYLGSGELFGIRIKG
ncbi:MAG: transporter substrate-binding domain-containing protein [Anaerolineae bacterium]|nr:transporter substrate-binding domain-containing protein [Anaerolineae bacterium]